MKWGKRAAKALHVLRCFTMMELSMGWESGKEGAGECWRDVEMLLAPCWELVAERLCMHTNLADSVGSGVRRGGFS